MKSGPVNRYRIIVLLCSLDARAKEEQFLRGSIDHNDAMRDHSHSGVAKEGLLSPCS